MGTKLQFSARSRIEACADDLFEWHSEPGALERLTPPWEPIEVEQPSPGIRDGDRGSLRVPLGPFRVRWVFEHRDYVEGRQFRDIQISGPFHSWEHTHLFTPDGPGACILEDRVEYELPLGAVGKFLGSWFVHRKLEKLFAYRHRVTAQAMAVHKEREPSLKPGLEV
ncbi:MAG: SRPBCC family protein [Candidatus Acidiferrales bacterium]